MLSSEPQEKQRATRKRATLKEDTHGQVRETLSQGFPWRTCAEDPSIITDLSQRIEDTGQHPHRSRGGHKMALRIVHHMSLLFRSSILPGASLNQEWYPSQHGEPVHEPEPLGQLDPLLLVKFDFQQPYLQRCGPDAASQLQISLLSLNKPGGRRLRALGKIADGPSCRELPQELPMLCPATRDPYSTRVRQGPQVAAHEGSSPPRRALRSLPNRRGTA